MLMPTVFHENLFDDFFDPFWNDAALERMMNREARDTFGKRGANMMKTDVKQTDNGYEVAAARILLRHLRAQFLRGRCEEGRHPRKVRGWRPARRAACSSADEGFA